MRKQGADRKARTHRERTPQRRPQARIGNAANSPAATATATGPALLLMLAYGAILLWAAWQQRLPVLALLAAPLLSALTFCFYWRDKYAAQRGAWRTPENTLHALSLLGGWPGAWIAQQVLRHKSRKTSFRLSYWATVVLHWAGLLAWLWWMPARG